MIGTFVFSENCPLTAGPSVNPVSGGGSGGGTAGTDTTGVTWTAAWPLSEFETLEIEAELTGSTGGTTDVYVQSSFDGMSWYDVVHFPQLPGGQAQACYRTAITRHPQSTADAPVVIGKNGTPALAANTTVQGGFGDRIRLWMVPGSGVSVGGNIKVNVCGARSTWR